MPFSRLIATRSTGAAQTLRTHVAGIVAQRSIDHEDVAMVVSTCRDSRCQYVIHQCTGDGYAPFMIGGMAGIPSGGSLSIDAALRPFDAPFVVAVAMSHARDGGAWPCAVLDEWQQGRRHDGNAEFAQLSELLASISDIDRSASQQEIAAVVARQTGFQMREWLSQAIQDGQIQGAAFITAMLLHGDETDELVLLDSTIVDG